MFCVIHKIIPLCSVGINQLKMQEMKFSELFGNLGNYFGFEEL